MMMPANVHVETVCKGTLFSGIPSSPYMDRYSWGRFIIGCVFSTVMNRAVKQENFPHCQTS